MDTILMRSVRGRCPDCGDDRILLQVDEVGLEFCCADCDAAVWVLEELAAASLIRRAG